MRQPPLRRRRTSQEAVLSNCLVQSSRQIAKRAWKFLGCADDDFGLPPMRETVEGDIAARRALGRAYLLQYDEVGRSDLADKCQRQMVVLRHHQTRRTL